MTISPREKNALRDLAEARERHTFLIGYRKSLTGVQVSVTPWPGVASRILGEVEAEISVQQAIIRDALAVIRYTRESQEVGIYLSREEAQFVRASLAHTASSYLDGPERTDIVAVTLRGVIKKIDRELRG